MKIFVVGVVLMGCCVVAAEDCFRPGRLWPDNNGVHINAHGGGVLYHDRVYYWFGEHKVAGERGNQAWEGVHGYSSRDLYHWQDEGIVLPVVKDDPNHPLTAGCILERPKVIYNSKTKQFVMWFHHELKDQGYAAALSGVAVSDRPTGPYRYLRSTRINAETWPMNVLNCHKMPVRPEVMERYYYGGGLPAHPDELNLLGKFYHSGQMARDMTLFVDDDGVAYHVFASECNSTIHIAELSDDFLSHTGKYKRVFIARWMEAPCLFKRDGKYYFMASGCTGWKPNTARYAVAHSIWGPWMEVGNPCEGPDAHLTFGTQSTFVLPVAGKPDAYIFMADQWRPDNAIDGRYLWLPIEFYTSNDGTPCLRIQWQERWDLRGFD